MRDRRKRNFDSRHKAAPLQPLNLGDIVWIPEDESEGIVVEETSPRSYTVQRQNRTLRRNCRDLILRVPSLMNRANHQIRTVQSRIRRNQFQDPVSNVVTRSGRVSKPPDRFVYLN